MPLHHHSLIAWQRADDLFVTVHRLSLEAFPPIERFALGAQLRRAGYSVAANIVEGFAYRPGRKRLQFLHISEASLAEVGYCIHVARRLGYVSAQTAQEIEEQVRRVGSPLSGLITSTRLKIGSEVVGALIFLAAAVAQSVVLL
jgi:four helix bundle protein